MRKEIKDLEYRLFTYQDVDRIPDVEFGYWPQTIKRWIDEGIEADIPEETRDHMFNSHLDRYFQFDGGGHRTAVNINCGINPCFEEEIIERKERSTIIKTSDGVVSERFNEDAEESSIPRYISAPVVTPDDWPDIKRRFSLDDPIRTQEQNDFTALRANIADGMAVHLALVGFYGVMRNWMGVQNLSTAFYDYPAMLHDMVEHWAELIATQVEALPPDITIDHVSWWEDMAGRNGPLVSPTTFREFFQPGYHRVMQAVKKHGCALAVVDCDGNPHDIVANWLEEDVNVMFPLEATDGVDLKAWRQEFGMQMRLKGGFSKAALAKGGDAIDREFDRLRPTFEEGGYIPHIDHLVPPDVSLKNYHQYLEKKRKFIAI